MTSVASPIGIRTLGMDSVYQSFRGIGRRKRHEREAVAVVARHCEVGQGESLAAARLARRLGEDVIQLRAGLAVANAVAAVPAGGQARLLAVGAVGLDDRESLAGVAGIDG